MLVFGVPRRCDLFGHLSVKRESTPLLYVGPQRSIFCGADFGSTTALDLQRKWKTVYGKKYFLSKESDTLRSYRVYISPAM